MERGQWESCVTKAQCTLTSAHHTSKRRLCVQGQQVRTGTGWHASRVSAQCTACGFHLLPICVQELKPDNCRSMTWRRFEQVPGGRTKKGEPKSVICLVYKISTPRSFLAYSELKISQFVLHQFVAKWQDTKFKNSLDALKEGEVISLIDFAENYSFKGQDEVQSQHWFNFQLTILVHITYTRNPNYNPMELSSKKLLTDYFYYISDDRVHDSSFVQHCLTWQWHQLAEAGNTPHRREHSSLFRGYMAPEYATRGQLTDKADVYSFGVNLMLEVVSGRKTIDFAAPPERVYLLEWASI